MVVGNFFEKLNVKYFIFGFALLPKARMGWKRSWKMVMICVQLDNFYKKNGCFLLIQMCVGVKGGGTMVDLSNSAEI